MKMMEKEDFDKDGFEAEIREKKRVSEARRKERAEVRAAFPQAERDRKKWRKVGRGVREVRKVAEDDDSQEMNSDEEPAPQMIFVDGKFLIDVNSLGKKKKKNDILFFPRSIFLTHFFLYREGRA